jgi:hypothetical protein
MLETRMFSVGEVIALSAPYGPPEALYRVEREFCFAEAMRQHIEIKSKSPFLVWLKRVGGISEIAVTSEIYSDDLTSLRGRIIRAKKKQQKKKTDNAQAGQTGRRAIALSGP